jgi:hypothetical protein
VYVLRSLATLVVFTTFFFSNDENVNPNTSISTTDCEAEHHQPEKVVFIPTDQRHRKSTATPKFAFAFSAICLACLTGLVLVVYISDDRSVGTWTPRVPAIQPSILISLLATLFNTFEFFILANGITIVWWRAKQKGATLRTLHYIKWNGPKEAWRAIFVSFGKMRVVIILMIASVIRIYDAPLLQRSIKPAVADYVDVWENTWALQHSIEEEWIGNVDSIAPAGLIASGDLDKVLKEWYTNATINTMDTCAGLCTGPVSGAGVAVECSSATHVVDLTDRSNNNQPLFKIDFSRWTNNSDASVLDMRLLYATEIDSQCRPTMATQSCIVRLANVTYSVIHKDITVALNHTCYPHTLARQPTTANASSDEGIAADTLSALEYFGHYFLQSNATIIQPKTPSDGFSWEPSGVLPRQYATFPSFEEANNNSCAFRWDNATDDLIWALHDVMFRMAIASSYGRS